MNRFLPILLENIKTYVKNMALTPIYIFGLRHLKMKFLKEDVKNLVTYLLDGLKDPKLKDTNNNSSLIILGEFSSRLSEMEVKTVIELLLQVPPAPYQADYAIEAMGIVCSNWPGIEICRLTKALLTRLKGNNLHAILETIEVIGKLHVIIPEAEVDAVIQALLFVLIKSRLKNNQLIYKREALKALSEFSARLCLAEVRKVIGTLLSVLDSLKSTNLSAKQLVVQRIKEAEEISDFGRQITHPYLFENLSLYFPINAANCCMRYLFPELRDQEQEIKSDVTYMLGQDVVKTLAKFSARLPAIEVKTVISNLLIFLDDENILVVADKIKDIFYSHLIKSRPAEQVKEESKDFQVMLGIKENISKVGTNGEEIPELLTKKELLLLLNTFKKGAWIERFNAADKIERIVLSLPASEIKVVLVALLNALKDDHQNVALPVSRTLNKLKVRLQEEDVKSVMEALWGVTFKYRDGFMKLNLIDEINDFSTTLPVDALETMTQQLLRALHDESFARGKSSLISLLVHFISPEYFDSVIALSIKKSLSEIDVASTPNLGSESIKTSYPALHVALQRKGENQNLSTLKEETSNSNKDNKEFVEQPLFSAITRAYQHTLIQTQNSTSIISSDRNNAKNGEAGYKL